MVTEEKTKYGYIFVIINEINNEMYVGRSRCFSKMNHYYGGRNFIENVVNPIGKINFKKVVVYKCKNEDEYNNKFELYLKEYNPVYNLKYPVYRSTTNIKDCDTQKTHNQCKIVYEENKFHNMKQYSNYYGYVFKVTNKKNNLTYIGNSRSMNRLNTYYGSTAFNKEVIEPEGGKENFNKEVLAFCNNKSEYIDSLKSLIKSHKPEYNDFLERKSKDNCEYGYVYMIVNNITKESYIGKDTCFDNMNIISGSTSTMDEMIKEIGEGNFVKEVLIYCKSKKELDEKELFFINAFKPKYNTIKKETKNSTYGYIYVILDKINNKTYIGQCLGEPNTDLNHIDSDIMEKVIAKYGDGNFTKEVITSCNSKEELDKKQTFYLDVCKPEYNIYL